MHNEIPTGLYEDYCSGYQNTGNVGNGYLLGMVIGVGKTKVSNIKEGSDNLEKIDAFDRAEVEDTNIGQINMITVSSFCGPMGKIWGLDLAKSEELYDKDEYTPSGVYSLKPLMQATKSLLGTIEDKRFPFMPGSHVPCASKYITSSEPTVIYSSLTIAIPKDRQKNACLLMEDIGEVNSINNETKTRLLERAVESVSRIGDNQKVLYNEIFTDLKMVKISKGEAGCALVAAPYFSIAKNAIPSDKSLNEISLSEWEKLVL